MKYNKLMNAGRVSPRFGNFLATSPLPRMWMLLLVSSLRIPFPANSTTLARHLQPHFNTTTHKKLIHLILKCTSNLTIHHLYQIQSQLLTSPSLLPLNPNLIAVKLIGICAASSKPRHALRVFTHLHDPNIFSYNAILKTLSQNNDHVTALHLFRDLVSSNLVPDEYTFTSVLKSSAGLLGYREGFMIHGVISKLGFDCNLYVANSLVDMYFKLGYLYIGCKLFDEMIVRDMVSWNTLISGYCGNGFVDDARRVFDQMVERNLVSWSTIISGYTRSGRLDEARRLFDEMGEKNVVIWNTMISGYAQNEKYSYAIDLFRSMQQVSGVRPNDVTLISVLSACAHLGALDLGKWIDGFVSRSNMDLNLFLGNALADMYAKCGCIVESRRIFEGMKERDAISWSIIITGTAMHGYINEAFGYFHEMVDHGVSPTDVTFMGLLTACTHAGLVDKGLNYFYMMEKKYGVSPTVEHYGCLVDMLSRSGRLKEAEEWITTMPMNPNVIVWGALLGGCQIYKDIERGKRAVQHILKLDPDHSGCYIYLANVYASTGRLDDAAKCRLKMRDNGVKKVPGCSWIEVNNTMHEFFMGDISHPESDKIYLMISELRIKMKLAGYKPKIDLVLHNIADEEKEDALSTHSEKLAIAFGLISTEEGTTIRIVKNLRVCNDCHDAIKIISKIVEREIIVRDRSRFHHFKNGECSCNNYW